MGIGRGMGGLMRDFAGLVRQNRRVALAAMCAVVFTVLLEDVLDGDLIKLDAAAYWLIVEHLRQDWLTPVMLSISALATPVALIVMLLVVAAFAPGRRPGLMCALNLGLVVVLNQTLKFIIQRPRPEGFRLAVETGFSFPSGHSMVAMAFFGLLAWLVWRYEGDRFMRRLCCIAFAFIVVMVGVSRIYLGVHYASDVLAGFCVSLAWLALYTRLVAPLFLGDIPRQGRYGGARGASGGAVAGAGSADKGADSVASVAGGEGAHDASAADKGAGAGRA